MVMTDMELVLGANKTARLEKSERGVRVIANLRHAPCSTTNAAFEVDVAAALSCWWSGEPMAWLEAAARLGLR